eukprot:8197227-Pyramimonas_sp.AAC.1
MNQAAGEMVHCAWMASRASGALPQSMPVATPAGERVPHQCPTPGLTSEPPSATTAPRHNNDDRYRPAYEELHYKLLSLIEDYPGAWASHDSVERKELLRETLIMHSNGAHALTWVVYEQLVDKIHDKAEANDANKSRISQERELWNSHRVGPRLDNSETTLACNGYYTQTALDRIE